MPYVPSEKTIPPAVDRKMLDPFIEAVAEEAASKITANDELVEVYVDVFMGVSIALFYLLEEGRWENVPDNIDEEELALVGFERMDDTPENRLACAIWETGEKYDYEGAFLGELNYAFTMFIQRVPAIKVKRGDWKEELRYWLYVRTGEALKIASTITLEFGLGIGGVIDDVLAEYKNQVNSAYEVAQILKSGHCYFGPYYKRPVEVVDEKGNHVGYMDVMLERSSETLHKDLLKGRVVLEMKKSSTHFPFSNVTEV